MSLLEELKAALAGADAATLRGLIAKAVDAFGESSKALSAAESISTEQVEELEGLRDFASEANAALVTIETADANKAKLADLVAAPPAAAAEPEVVAQEQEPVIPEPVTPPTAEIIEAPVALAASIELPPSDNPGATSSSALEITMVPNAPRYTDGSVDMAAVAESFAAISPGTTMRSNRGAVGGQAATAIARFGRTGLPTIGSDKELEEWTQSLNDPQNYRPAQFDSDGALAASASWCAPTQITYDFCPVPGPTGLVTLPTANLPRSGIRYPAEPNFTDLYANLPFRFTNAQLAVQPPPTKPCVEVPCPTTFIEVLKEAIGLCITSGILQQRGWPELVQRFLTEAVNAHQRAISLWTVQEITDTVGGPAIAATYADGPGATGSILNALEHAATNIRLADRYPRTSNVQVLAPSWILNVIRSDLAYRNGLDELAISDARINALFTARNLDVQWIDDWQARGVGQPGNTATVAWPTTAQFALFRPGVWQRHLANVFEVGSVQDLALLRTNMQLSLFTEDEFSVWSRCGTTIVATVPICVSGAIGQREFVACNTPAP